MTFTAVTSSGAKKVATFGTADNDAAAVAAGKWVHIWCSDKASDNEGLAINNGAAGALSLSITTHSDTDASDTVVAYTITAADGPTGTSSTRTSTANGAAPGPLTLNFIPNVAPANTNTYIFTFAVETKVFEADDSDNSLSACTITQASKAGAAGAFFADTYKDSTFAVSSTGTVLTMTVVTAGIGIMTGHTATITCPTNFVATNGNNK